MRESSIFVASERTAAAMSSASLLLLVASLGLLVVALADAGREGKQALREQAVRKNEFPFMVRIIIWNDTLKRDEYCGGTLVDERFVLTSASCICNTKSPNSIVRLEYIKIGTGCLREDQCDHPYRLSKAIVHKNFGPGGKFDLALLKVNKEMALNGDPQKGPFVSPITFEIEPLCSGAGGQDNRLMTLLGWGTDDKNRRIRELRQFTLTQIHTDTCKRSLPFIHKESSVCYGSSASDACRFDMGSPLLNQYGLTSYTQIGMVSDRGLCGDQKAGKSSLIPFQSLSAHFRWITSCIATEGSGRFCPSVVSDVWW